MTTTTNSARGSGVRRRNQTGATPNLNHLTPQTFVDPIRSVKRASVHWKRKVFHVLGIGTVAVAYALTPVEPFTAAAIMSVFGALFILLDASRFFIPALNNKVKRDFGPLMRDYELDGLSGSSWFLVSAVISLALFPKTAAALGILCLAVGDPFASFVGVKWGRTKLPGNKSLEGSLALVGICTVAGTILLVGTAGVAPLSALGLAFATAVAAAFAEALPIKKVDDNFVVPLLAGGAATALLALL